MAIKSSTSSSLKMFNNYQSLEYTMFIIGTKFSLEIKVITMMRNYDQSVEIND